MYLISKVIKAQKCVLKMLSRYCRRVQHLSVIDKCSRNILSNDIVNLNTSHQVDLNGIYWILHSMRAGYTNFSSSHETFTKISHILNLETPQHIRRTEIIQSILSNQKVNRKSIMEWRSLKITEWKWRNKTVLTGKWHDCLCRKLSSGKLLKVIRKYSKVLDSKVDI